MRAFQRHKSRQERIYIKEVMDQSSGHVFSDEISAHISATYFCYPLARDIGLFRFLNNYGSVFDEICTVGKLSILAFQRHNNHQKRIYIEKVREQSNFSLIKCVSELHGPATW